MTAVYIKVISIYLFFKGPGVFEGYGATQFGGRLPFRLAEMCETYRGAEEANIYQKWLDGGKVYQGIQDSFFF